MKNRMSVARCCCVSTGGVVVANIIQENFVEATWNGTTWEEAVASDDPKIGYSGAEYMQTIRNNWDGVLPGATTITGSTPSGTLLTFQDVTSMGITPSIRVELIQGSQPGDQAPSPTPLPTPVDSFTITPSFNAGTNRWEYALSYTPLLQWQLDHGAANTFFMLRATWPQTSPFQYIEENVATFVIQTSDTITEISYV